MRWWRSEHRHDRGATVHRADDRIDHAGDDPDDSDHLNDVHDKHDEYDRDERDGRELGHGSELRNALDEHFYDRRDRSTGDNAARDDVDPLNHDDGRRRPLMRPDAPLSRRVLSNRLSRSRRAS